MNIPFNKPFLTGNETKYIEKAVLSQKISGDGNYTKLCHEFFEKKYGFKKVLLTTSCTDALEMAALLLNIKEGDEVIMPSYTFVSTANAFVLRGAKIIFVDSQRNHPNLDADLIEELITEKTKVIVPVHYSGMACDMVKIMHIAKKYNIFVVEDAAQAIDSYYNGKPLGSFGHFGTFSFHETKNIISGEGGMLVINDENYIERAEIIREKGTNRSQFYRGDVDKYGWMDIGSSFLPSDIIAAFLFAQLEKLEEIQNKRKYIWNKYYEELKDLELRGKLKLPILPNGCTNNAHLFYMVIPNNNLRDSYLSFMREFEINPVFHYLSLHKSMFYKNKHGKRELNESDRYSETLVRLPLFYSLEEEEIDFIVRKTKDFFI
jgi:dTDP-4-amino-4,6-dideoxygalactose transaminase